MSELLGKNALVTGGSRGIGASIAMALADKGADVAISYEHSGERAAELVRAIEAKGRRGLAIQANLRTHPCRRKADGQISSRVALGGARGTEDGPSRRE